MIEILIGVMSAGMTIFLFMLGLVLKRVSEIDGKIDKHISESESVRIDVGILKDRSERK